MDLLEGEPFGPYRIVARVGRGGMAEIYLAQRTGPGGFARDLVIKRILPYLAADPEFVRMFVNEAAILARLTHSNIAQVYDFGRIDRDYYLAMEYVRGTSLDRLLAVHAGEGMPIAHAVRVTTEIARGLDYAHRATDAHGRPLSIVHSDVSPSNVLISFEGEVKLIDFGIARSTGRRDDSRGTIKGKVRYMSPEQSRGLPLDPRTDVFSLGIVLWESLTGGNLYDHDDPTDVMEALQRKPAPPARGIRADVPPALDIILQCAMAKDADERFQTADEMARALDFFLAEQRLPATAADVGALVRSRFAPTLVISIRDEGAPRAKRTPAVPQATVVAVPDAGAATAVSVTGAPAPRAAEIGLGGPAARPDATAVDSEALAAPALPPVVPTPLPDRAETLPGTSVIVAEPLAPARRGDSERRPVPSFARPATRAGDSERLEVQSVPVTDAVRKGPDTAVRWLAASWHTWSVGTRVAAGFAVAAVLVAAAVLIYLALGDAPEGAPPAPPGVATGPQPGPPVVVPPSPAVADAGGAKVSTLPAPPLPGDAATVRPDAGPEAIEERSASTTSESADGGGDGEREDAAGTVRFPPPEAQPATGLATIDSRPWSIVRWRDQVLGETPVVDAVLPAGIQTLILTDESGVEHRRTVRVPRADSVRIRFDLAEQPAEEPTGGPPEAP